MKPHFGADRDFAAIKGKELLELLPISSPALSQMN